MGILDFLKRKCSSCEEKKPEFRCTLCGNKYCEPCVRSLLEVWQSEATSSQRAWRGSVDVFDAQGRTFCLPCLMRQEALATVKHAPFSALQRSCVRIR